MKQSDAKTQALEHELQEMKRNDQEQATDLMRLMRSFMELDARVKKFEQAQIDQMILDSELEAQAGGSYGGPA